MSGIVGIWNVDGRPVDREVLGKMAATLAHRGSDGCFFWSEGAVGLACQLFKVTPESFRETQPWVGPSGSVVVFDGRLDNREEILGSLPERKVSSDAPDPELVLAAYDAFGEKLPEHLNGDFTLAVFDPARRKLLLARDAIGVRPLYYCRTGQTLLFASEVKALLAYPDLPRKPNDDVLGWFFFRQAGVDAGSLTLFDGISSVAPAHLVIATPEGVVTRRYWDFDRWRRIRLGSFEEYAEAFRPLFEQAVRRRLRSAYPVAVSVSGGLDSSSIFCSALRMKQQSPSHLPGVFGISHTYDSGTPPDERFFLAEIERCYGVNIQRFPAPTGFWEVASDLVWYGEFPVLDEAGNCFRELTTRMRAAGARSFLTGLWGDQMLFDQSYLVTLFRRLAWLEIHRHIRAYDDWYPEVPPRIFWNIFVRDVLRSYVPEALLRWTRKYRLKFAKSENHGHFYTKAFRQRSCPPLDPPQAREFASYHARAIYSSARQGWYLHCMEMDNKLASKAGLEMCFPFLDRDLVAFLMAIPGEMQSWQGVPKGILRQAMKGVLPETIGLRRGKSDFTDFANQSMAAARPRLLPLFDGGGMAIQRGYVEPAVVEELRRLNDPAPGADNRFSSNLSDVFGLELWLQLFFGNNPSERNLR